ncbi:MAG: Mov34/MPN/PAD family protein [Bryobacterales bacterium]|nr:Mov34/MPN/PAD family protein [Bryobacterales bacterium]
MSDVTFGTWSVAASPVTIEYSLVVVEEVRHEVAEGFQKLSRGGIEVGGLLYGVREGQTIRIMAIRPAACEHASGPAFRLSERDRAALVEQIRQDLQDPRLDGLVCVGWYVSHTRTEITLSESDQEIFSTYFGEPWQVTLVVRPSRGGNMRAGFFVREPDGTVSASQSYLEFSFPDRLAAAFDHRGSFAERKPPEYRSASTPRAANPVNVPAEDARRYAQSSAETSPPLTSLFGDPIPERESKSSGKKWFGLVAALIVVAALVVAATRFLPFGAANESIALGVLEREGQLDIEWNRAAAPVSNAVRGALEIVDGPDTRTIPLAPRELALGKFSYKRETGDIQVRMSVEGADGKKVQEASRFLGPPPAKGNVDELKELQQRRDELEAEVARLKQSNDQQAERIQQLERTLKILQTRPGN